MKQLLIVITSVFFVASCATYDGAPDDFSKDASEIRNAVPRNEPLSRYGNPEFYTVNGQAYKVMDSSLGFVQKRKAREAMSRREIAVALACAAAISVATRPASAADRLAEENDHPS